MSGSEVGDEDDGEWGARRVERKHEPKGPSERERQEHSVTHLPFRSWCRHCVRGQGTEEPCKRTKGEGPEIPEVHLDFMFMGEETGGRTLAVLVARERGSKATMSTVAPRKSSGEWLARRVNAWMKEIGCAHGNITVKSDNEPALVALVEALGRERAVSGSGRMAMEHSPTLCSKSNGVIERAIRIVQGMVRTLRSAVEEKWGVSIGIDHAVWSWLIEYAGWLLSRCQVGKDGRTAYERIKGKRAKIQGLEFGEGVLWKRKRAGGPLGKLACMWNDGVFLGMKGGTGEIIVGDERGVWVTRSVRRKPIEERWDRENLGRIVGVPWRKSEGDECADGEGMETDVRVMDSEYRERLEAKGQEPVPRRAYIHKRDLERIGYIVGCPGCVSVVRGGARQAHTERCRRRVEEELKGTDRMRAAEKRRREFLDRAGRWEDMKSEWRRRKRSEREAEGSGRGGDEAETEEDRRRRRRRSGENPGYDDDAHDGDGQGRDGELDGEGDRDGER